MSPIIGTGRAEPAAHALDIEVSGVCKRYASDHDEIAALQDVSFDVAGGSFVSVVGPSGCGKSTLLRMLAGLEEPTEGTVTVGGETVRRPHPELGMVFQQDLLLPWRNVMDNVLLQADVRGIDRRRQRDRVLELLGQVGLSGFEERHPRELSGGMRQRVAICRALLHEPRMLLMDEPYAALDAITRDQMTLDLSQLTANLGTTVVFVTHSIPEAVLLSERVLVMSTRPGRIVNDVEIPLPRPRDLNVRRSEVFARCVEHVIDIFESLGVLGERGTAATVGAA